ncbi:MAG TPA: PQQ-dependent sugar dehydrogenase [Gemmataceae bacterium]|nr:PQQ-dependent sugar dehydrogenase [Gemmataceae bacterium]
MRNIRRRCQQWAGRMLSGRAGNSKPGRTATKLRLQLLEDKALPAPTVVDPNLAVRTVVSGLNQPTTMAFIGENDFFVLEKATGKVQRVTNGALAGTVLDLAVNNGSERGLLGIALHPDFPQNPGVYLYWTESSTGADTSVLSQTPLLGNRVDRFVWDGSTLTFDKNLIHLRALQPAFPAEPSPAAGRGNHDGGIIRFEPRRDNDDRDDDNDDDNDHDKAKLLIMIGDNGRRGQLQNLPDGPGVNPNSPPPTPTTIPQGNQPDDSFGGPEPDDAHLTGVILRLNDDGTTPTDNPFFKAGALRGGEAGANLQKVFAYGLRNGFGMAFDPNSGRLWDSQNGDDSFSELNRIEAGANLGWIQAMGPVSRVGQFKAIETDRTAPQPFVPAGYFGLQQGRWLPTNIADTPAEAKARMFQVFEGGKRFSADLVGGQENPAVDTTAAAHIELKLTEDGTLRFKLKATRDIEGVTQAHLHLGARGQNGPIVAFLVPFNPAGQNFRRGEVMAEGELDDAAVLERPGFGGTVAELAERMRQQRVYANVHTLDHPGGEIRGQVEVHAKQVSHYSDPEFSWKFEVAPTGLGFLNSSALGREYEGDMFLGEARTFLEGGFLFRMNLTRNRKDIAVSDPRLADKVADNNFKFDITESETLLFGRNFGIGTDIQTGPNGNLFVVSLSDGAVYEIFRAVPEGRRAGHAAAATSHIGKPGGALLSAEGLPIGTTGSVKTTTTVNVSDPAAAPTVSHVGAFVPLSVTQPGSNLLALGSNEDAEALRDNFGWMDLSQALEL